MPLRDYDNIFEVSQRDMKRNGPNLTFVISELGFSDL